MPKSAAISETDARVLGILQADGRRSYADLGTELCSPQSPLGTALFGAITGGEREFVTPDGRRVRVSVLSALPHRAAV